MLTLSAEIAAHIPVGYPTGNLVERLTKMFAVNHLIVTERPTLD